METNCPNILYLSGITIEECLQTKKTATDTLNTNDDEAEVEKKLPSVFTTVSKWVTHSSFKCWTCHLYFKTVPKFVPTYMREMSEERLRWAFSATFAAFHAPPLMLMCTILSPKGGRPASC